MAHDDTKTRCIVCGKPIHARHRMVRITQGRMTLGAGFLPDRVYGEAHSQCFASAVEAPGLVLDELRQAADEPSTETAPR